MTDDLHTPDRYAAAGAVSEAILRVVRGQDVIVTVTLPRGEEVPVIRSNLAEGLVSATFTPTLLLQATALAYRQLFPMMVPELAEETIAITANNLRRHLLGAYEDFRRGGGANG